MSRLVALALSCDLTRVFSVMFSGSVGETAFTEVGEDRSHHQFTHDEAGDQPRCTPPRCSSCGNWGTCCRHGRHPRRRRQPAGQLGGARLQRHRGRPRAYPGGLPILVAGRAGGRLRYPGIHYRSDTAENTSMVLLSVLRAAGLALPEFGRKGGRVDSSLTALEA